MGISVLHSSSSYDYGCNTVRDKNPNPENYKIINNISLSGYLIVFINYPDCDNYEGNKILVYKNCDIYKLKKQKSIDPHFSENEKFYSPMARFVPTEEGWNMAINFIRSL